jgi:hypothetical protein
MMKEIHDVRMFTYYLTLKGHSARMAVYVMQVLHTLSRKHFFRAYIN